MCLVPAAWATTAWLLRLVLVSTQSNCSKVNRMVLLRLVLFRLQVKKVESYGSGSGRTSKKIVIADCGQLS